MFDELYLKRRPVHGLLKTLFLCRRGDLFQTKILVWNKSFMSFMFVSHPDLLFLLVTGFSLWNAGPLWYLVLVLLLTCFSSSLPTWWMPFLPSTVILSSDLPLYSPAASHFVYLLYLLVYNKHQATSLLPHRACDCAIDRLPGTTPPRSRLYIHSLNLNVKLWTHTSRNPWLLESYDSLFFTCWHWLLFCWWKAWQTSTLYWLQKIWRHHNQEPVSAPAHLVFRLLQGTSIYTKLDLCKPTTLCVSAKDTSVRQCLAPLQVIMNTL